MGHSLNLSLAPLLPVRYFVNPLTNVSPRSVRGRQFNKENFSHSLRKLERVFRCCSVCETMEDYKGYLMVWTNYMSLCNSIVGL